MFIDMGFAQASKKSCGLAIAEEEPRNVRFSDLINEVKQAACSTTSPLNLLIEAPLSVAFDRAGNPGGRSIERRGSLTRYWYVGLGCSVLLAATYLMRSIYETQSIRDIRLVEGFASFKAKGTKSSHIDDVRRLREVVWAAKPETGKIIAPRDLRRNTDDQLQSAFSVSGMDCGIPPVVMI